jgi:hypothetical protein
MIIPKVFAFGAFVVDAGIALWQTPAIPSIPEFAVGAGAGGSVALFVYWVVKPTLDRHDKEFEELRRQKADTKDLDPLKEGIERIEGTLKFISERLMGK